MTHDSAKIGLPRLTITNNLLLSGNPNRCSSRIGLDKSACVYSSQLQLAITGHNRPIGAHFHSGGAKFPYLGEDLYEAFGWSEEPIAGAAVCERATEHLHDMLSGD